MRPAEAMLVPPPLIIPVFDGGDVVTAERRALAPGEILSPADILLDSRATRKREALWHLSGLLAQRTGGTREAVLAALLRRERLGSTYIGGGMAMPHGRSYESLHPAAAVLRLRQPVDYGTSDGDSADLLVAVLWPQGDPPGFVPTLARVWRFLRTPSVSQAIKQARTSAELHFSLALAGDPRP